MESRNFTIVTDKKLKQAFYWDDELTELPEDVVAFKYYKGDGEEIEIKDYVTGVPVKANMSNMTLEMVADPYQYQPNMVCLYKQDGVEMLFAMTPDTKFVNNYSELNQEFTSLNNRKTK